MTGYLFDTWLLLPFEFESLRALSFIVTHCAVLGIPLYFRGNAVAPITGGLTSRAFMGFAGPGKFR